MNNNTDTINFMKSRARVIIEDILDIVLSNPRYLLECSKYRVWVSFRKKTRTLCITPTIIHSNLDSLKWFHLTLFSLIKIEFDKEEWDNTEADCFLLNTCFFNTKTPPNKLPEKAYTISIN